jgi:hypothetical protein
MVCHAENLCPWINKATAFGVLGVAENSPLASMSEISSTACSFTYRAENFTRELRVSVERAENPQQTFSKNKAQCDRGGIPLRTIGNEAVMCAEEKNGRGEQIFGRVRDNVYTIVVKTSSVNDSDFSREALKQKAQLVAEQVSGNLF